MQPNILFVMPDQQRFDTIAAPGHPHVHTPNLDRLAARGAACTNAYSTCPVCVPARYSLMTGCEPLRTGWFGRKTNHRGISFKVLHELTLGQSVHKISAGFRENKDTNYGYAYYESRVFANVATVVSDNSGPLNVSLPGAPRSVFKLSDPGATNITGVASATNPDPLPVTSA